MFRSLAVQGSFVLIVGFVVHARGLDIADAILGAWRSAFSSTIYIGDHGIDELRSLPSIQTLGTVLMWLGAALVVLDAHQRGVAKRWKE
jgi:hypothetical protein